MEASRIDEHRATRLDGQNTARRHSIERIGGRRGLRPVPDRTSGSEDALQNATG